MSGQSLGGQFTGTRHLVRLLLRRDRIRIPVWVVGIIAMTGVSASAVQGFYAEPAQIASYGAMVESSASARLFGGMPHDLDTIGGITAYEITAVGSIMLGLMMVFLVVRHTRAEEETGQAELVRSAIVGRHAATLAALIVAVGCTLLVGALDAVMLIALDMPAAGALGHGAALASIGLAFTGIAAIAAQVVSSARGALALAATVIGVLFVGRGAAAANRSDLVWISPFAWQEGLRPFGETRWWLLAPLLGLALVLLVAAGALTARRDYGAGMVHPRKGHARAGRFTSTPIGLALRTQRGPLIGWTAGLLALGLVFGSFSGEIGTFAESNPDILVIMGADEGDLVRSYYAFVVTFTCILATAFTISSVLRLRHDERAGVAEPVLTTAISRTHWALAGALVALLGTIVVMGVAGLGTAAMHVGTTGEGELFGPLVGAALSYVPAAVLLIGLGLLLHGLVPRLAPALWVLFAFAMLQSYLGEVLDLPDWAAGISPFWHLPLVPSEPWEVAPAAVLTALGVVGVAAGLVGLRRRDLG